MTFYEAAVEVLRRSGRPLHFKKITEVAIRDELLSHVGKSPEDTMEDRLDQETKKDDASWIVRTRPGVYMLKAEVAERLNDEAKAKDEENRKKREEQRKQKAKAPVEEDSEAEELDEESDAEEDEEDEEGEEEDEDEDAVEADGDAEEEEDEGGSGRGRRRRRRRGRRSSSSSSESTDKSAEAKTESEAPKRNGRDRGDRGRGGRRGRRDKDKDTSKDRSPKKKGSFDDLDGERFESIAESAFAVLEANNRQPMSAADVAEIVFDKKLVKFHTHDPEATIESAIITDNQVRARSGRRPLFAQYRDGRWGLTQWGVSDEGIEKEQQILSIAAELREEAHDQLGEAISSLKDEAFEMVVMTLLERLDYGNLKVSKRTSDGDTYFSADWRRGFSDLRVCVHVAADAETTLQADAIKELRDTLEHYSAAEGIVVHIGEISKDAVRESRKEGAAKVTILDRKTFVRLLIDEGIGVRTFQTPLVMVDTAFIDTLQR